MPRVEFTTNLKRHVVCPSRDIGGASVAEVLGRLFEEDPGLRGYVLDDQGALRRHMNIFVNGEPVRDRKRLSDAVEADTTIYVFQALSGG